MSYILSTSDSSNPPADLYTNTRRIVSHGVGAMTPRNDYVPELYMLNALKAEVESLKKEVEAIKQELSKTLKAREKDHRKIAV